VNSPEWLRQRSFSGVIKQAINDLLTNFFYLIYITEKYIMIVKYTKHDLVSRYIHLFSLKILKKDQEGTDPPNPPLRKYTPLLKVSTESLENY